MTILNSKVTILLYDNIIILNNFRDKAEEVTEWAAKYVIKRINAFNPGPNK